MSLRNYLQLDPKDTTYSGQELKNMVIEKWEILSSDSITTNSAPEDDSVLSPTQSRNKRSRDSVSATVSTKRKKEETPSTSQSRLILNNWWKVTNCVTETSTCSGTTDAGFVVTQPFPNRELATNSELPGEGNVIYILGNHASDGDQVEDNFGPWPAKMSGLNAVHLQFRSLMSESITEFSTRLGMNVAGSRLDHLSSSMLLFNTLKLLNAIEVRKALKKAVDV